ncbi:MAG: tRNA pseudouridine(55) synthase TruB, partial [Treponema sp.]|nr:tRNA pseudouridine(55) synthase TruB [Treponema sp.]
MEKIAGTKETYNGLPSAQGGLLLLRKKTGLTSFEALYEVKRALKTSKVGHTGTLDKFAEGLLPVLVGRAVKLSPWFSHCDKQYEGKIRFGLETDTLDPEGQTAAEGPLPSREAVEAALPRFRGEILQAPPAYSAIHLGGKRASELARAGETPEMKKRPVSIYRLELTAWDPPFAEIAVHCSSGVYIRSLARDIALAAGSRAHLAALVRTQVAGFGLSQAVSGGDDDESRQSLAAALLPINRALIENLGLPWFELAPEDLQKFIHGKPLSQILAGRELRHPLSGPERM